MTTTTTTLDNNGNNNAGVTVTANKSSNTTTAQKAAPRNVVRALHVEVAEGNNNAVARVKDTYGKNAAQSKIPDNIRMCLIPVLPACTNANLTANLTAKFRLLMQKQDIVTKTMGSFTYDSIVSFTEKKIIDLLLRSILLQIESRGKASQTIFHSADPHYQNKLRTVVQYFSNVETEAHCNMDGVVLCLCNQFLQFNQQINKCCLATALAEADTQIWDQVNQMYCW